MKSKNILALTILLSSSLSPLTVFADNNIEPAISEVPESVLSQVNRTDSEGVQENPEKIEVNQNEQEENNSFGQPDSSASDLGSTEQIIDNQDEGSESIDSWMPDQQLQIAVAEALGITVGELTKEKVAELGTESNNKVGNNNISDLSALKNIPLSVLIIKNNNISTLSGWGLSGSLKTINADSNHISEISSIGSSTTMFLVRDQTITNPPINMHKKSSQMMLKRDS